MNLDFTPDELAFREEARDWLAANVPAEPLPSMYRRLRTFQRRLRFWTWERAASKSAVSKYSVRYVV